MGLFDKIFSSSNGTKDGVSTGSTTDETVWIDLNSVDQLDHIVEESKTKVQLIFKHSTRCGISRRVMSQFKKDYHLEASQADLYYLDLLNHRDISAAIAERFKVVHESPQLLVVKNGVVVKHASHGGINDIAIESLV